MKREHVIYNPKVDMLEVVSTRLKLPKAKPGQFVMHNFVDKKTKQTIISVGPYLYLGVL